jgi:type VI secretion system secreted protein VgrG
MSDRIQAYRDTAVGTALGEDVLLLQSMHFTEQLGRPFQGELDLYSETDDKIDFSKIIGTDMTVRLEQGTTGTRYFNGYVSRFVQSSRTGRLSRYHATIVPWIWFLTRTSDCRIFQNQKIPDIVQGVLKEKGYTDVELQLSGTYTPKEYVVQYRETDFNFISRLLEREGIYYFFRHDNGKHTMVLCDSPSAHKAYPEYATIPYRAVSTDANREYISDWTIEQTVEPGLYSLNDFDFTAPKKSLLAKAQASATYAQSDHEIYDYPGEYTKSAEGQEYSKVRIEELQAQQEVVSASSDALGISAGFTFTLTDPPRTDQTDEHLITSASIQISSDQFDAGKGSGGGKGGPMFSAHFTAIKSKTQFRSPRITPKPVMQGPQTAIIVGKKGEEIWTDEYGRVKVQFHWDRYNKADENSSCWIRVSQEWAGKKWGSIRLPRIGHEVIVDFLEGDPDQPIVTGRVYNGDNKPPYPLPAEATKSTTKSLSSKGGGGFNEIRFEDKKGSEQVFIHAQHNMDVHVNASHMESVGGSKHLTVGGEKDGVRSGVLNELVYKDHNVYIKESRNEKIGGNVQQLIGQGEGPGGNLDLYIDKQRTEYVGKGYDLHVKGDRQEAIDGGQSLTVGGSQQEKIGMKHAVDAGQEIHLKAGMNVTIEAGMQLTIKAAGGFISIGPAGVTIQGTMVLINSGGAAGSGSGSSPTAPKDALIAAPVAPAGADNAKAGAITDAVAPPAHKITADPGAPVKVSPSASSLAKPRPGESEQMKRIRALLVQTDDDQEQHGHQWSV